MIAHRLGQLLIIVRVAEAIFLQLRLRLNDAILLADNSSGRCIFSGLREA
jgi:hypothetical protein